MSMLTLPQALALAVQHHQAGKLPEAEAIYRQILAQQPNHVDALQFLGIIASQTGRHDVAVEMIRRAIVFAPQVASLHCNLGEAYRQLGQLEEAIAEFRWALQLQPGLAEAYNNLGVALRQQGRFGEAVTAYRHALELQPWSADVCNNLGVALSGLGQSEEETAAYRRALEIDPHCAKTLNNLAGALCLQGRTEEAIAVYHRALDVQPGYAVALNNLGSTLIEARRLDEAVEACRKAVELEPDYAQAHNHLGSVLKDQGLIDEAIARYSRATELSPHSPEMHSNLVYAALFQSRNDWHALQEGCARWDARHGMLQEAARPHENEADPNRRLRVGYVSPDFRDQVIGRNLIPLFAAHDHTAFEVVSYSGVARPDRLTARFQSLSDQWRTTFGVTDAALAAMIRADRIDILVDLTQHMSGNRLPVFAQRPAPVQVSFAGYPASTGLSAIPHRISDRYVEGGGMLEESREHIWRIDSFWCYDPCGVELAVNALPATDRGFVTFGCLNNFCKINEHVLVLWAEVLRRVPASRLCLLSHAGSHRQRLIHFLAKEGVEASRVEFIAHQPRTEYLAQYHSLDIVLDTFPYNGHTTSLDALWMGVPVISLAGETPVSRGGLSILKNLGLPELAAESTENYVQKVVALAEDLPRLARLRASLRQRMESSVLMDARHFARQIEQVYRNAWRAWCAER